MPIGAHAVCREGGSRAEFSGRVGPTVRHGQKGKTASFRNQEAIGRDAFSQPPPPFLMILFRQIPSTSLFYQALVSTIVNFVVKTRGNVPVAPAMRSIFHELAPDYALDNFETMQEAVDQSNFSSRMGLYLTGAFAGMAVLMVMLVRCSRPARQLSPPRIRDTSRARGHARWNSGDGVAAGPGLRRCRACDWSFGRRVRRQPGEKLPLSSETGGRLDIFRRRAGVAPCGNCCGRHSRAARGGGRADDRSTRRINSVVSFIWLISEAVKFAGRHYCITEDLSREESVHPALPRSGLSGQSGCGWLQLSNSRHSVTRRQSGEVRLIGGEGGHFYLWPTCRPSGKL